MSDPAASTEDWKTAVNALVQVRSHGVSEDQADESFAQQRIQQLESELQRLHANLETASALAGEVASLREAKQQLEARMEGLERERSEHSAQISRVVSTFDLIETELRTYMVHTTDYAEVGREVGLKFGPEDIHVMCRMGGY